MANISVWFHGLNTCQAACQQFYLPVFMHSQYKGKQWKQKYCLTIVRRIDLTSYPLECPVDNQGFADHMLGITGLGNLALSLLVQAYNIWILSSFCPRSVLFLELSWHNKIEVYFLLNPSVLWDVWNFRVIVLYLSAILARLFM